MPSMWIVCPLGYRRLAHDEVGDTCDWCDCWGYSGQNTPEKYRLVFGISTNAVACRKKTVPPVPFARRATRLAKQPRPLSRMAAEGVQHEATIAFRCTSEHRRVPRRERSMNGAEDNPAVTKPIVTDWHFVASKIDNNSSYSLSSSPCNVIVAVITTI